MVLSVLLHFTGVDIEEVWPSERGQDDKGGGVEGGHQHLQDALDQGEHQGGGQGELGGARHEDIRGVFVQWSEKRAFEGNQEKAGE